MRLPIVFVSSALFLAGFNAAYPTTNVLATRSADSDALAEFSARAFEEKLEFYARGGTLSRKGQKLKDQLKDQLKKLKKSKKPKKHVDQEPEEEKQLLTPSNSGFAPTSPERRPGMELSRDKYRYDANHGVIVIPGPSGSRSRRAFYEFDSGKPLH